MWFKGRHREDGRDLGLSNRAGEVQPGGEENAKHLAQRDGIVLWLVRA